MVWIDRWVSNLDEENLRLKEEIRVKIRSLTMRGNMSDKWI